MTPDEPKRGTHGPIVCQRSVDCGFGTELYITVECIYFNSSMPILHFGGARPSGGVSDSVAVVTLGPRGSGSARGDT